MKIYMVFMIVALLVGCGSTGKPIKKSSVENFVKGETTTQRVLAALGKPQSKTQNSDGTSQLVYMHVDTKVHASTFIPILGAFTGGATSNVQSLVITLDKQGVVTDLTQTDTETVYNN